MSLIFLYNEVYIFHLYITTILHGEAQPELSQKKNTEQAKAVTKNSK